jgi:transposase
MSQQPSPVKQLSDAECAMMSASGQAVVLELSEENRQLKLSVSQLQEQLRRNSHNSSQPPSQDKPEQKQANEGEPPERRQRRGGQVGHAGHKRELLPRELVDQVVVHRPVQCQQGSALLLGEDAAPCRFPVTEWPVLKATVTEHQVQTVTCLCCGAKNRGELPGEVAASQFGPNLVSLMALLMGCYR